MLPIKMLNLGVVGPKVLLLFSFVKNRVSEKWGGDTRYPQIIQTSIMFVLEPIDFCWDPPCFNKAAVDGYIPSGNSTVCY